jgi:hypothetical protein
MRYILQRNKKRHASVTIHIHCIVEEDFKRQLEGCLAQHIKPRPRNITLSKNKYLKYLVFHSVDAEINKLKFIQGSNTYVYIIFLVFNWVSIVVTTTSHYLNTTSINNS